MMGQWRFNTADLWLVLVACLIESCTGFGANNLQANCLESFEDSLSYD
jgi:hypothetical protein